MDPSAENPVLHVASLGPTPGVLAYLAWVCPVPMVKAPQLILTYSRGRGRGVVKGALRSDASRCFSNGHLHSNQLEIVLTHKF